jgi:N-acetyl-anhydromuramyl-L-alanine amidase AmpD
VVTFHAGLSILNGRERCNEFTIGIEFQGNTVEKPLTDDQIQSAIDYLLPIIDQYQIPLDSIVTHEMVRANYMRQYPEKKCKDKCDITPPEYERVMKALRAAYQQHQEDRS